MEQVIKGISGKILGKISVPGDKSISHRAVLLGSLAHGVTEIEGFLMGEDCLSTISCIKRLGINVEVMNPGHLRVLGKGLFGFREPSEILDAKNSGTTMRLMLGLLAGQSFHTVIKGDPSLNNRPMGRIVNPLRSMGARIDGRDEATKAPISVRGGNIQPIIYHSPVSSAQVKSAILIAGLYADGETTVIEPAQSRDHTERMLASFGAEVKFLECLSAVKGLPHLVGQKILVPGDISSAAFFMVAAAITPGSELMIENIGINPSRTGIIDVLKRMGGKITVENQRIEAGEPVADVIIRYSDLSGITVEGEDIPRLIDEIPVLTVAAAHAKGTTIIKDAAELRVKETDRISCLTSEMIKMGIEMETREDGMIIYGKKDLKGTLVNSFYDHRIAMALAVAAISAQGVTTIQNAESVNISFPGFFELLNSLAVGSCFN